MAIIVEEQAGCGQGDGEAGAYFIAPLSTTPGEDEDFANLSRDPVTSLTGVVPGVDATWTAMVLFVNGEVAFRGWSTRSVVVTYPAMKHLIVIFRKLL